MRRLAFGDKLKASIRPLEHPAFVTHANYLKYMSNQSLRLELTCELNITKRISQDKRVAQKVKLIELTLENLRGEKNNIDKYPDYAVICVSWIPVKSYYLFFNLLLLIQYLKSARDTDLTITHSGLVESFRNSLECGEFKFNNKNYNSIHSVADTWSWTIPKSENVKRRTADENLRFKQIIKKLVLYKTDDFKRYKKIRRLAGKTKLEFSQKKVNLCEFLYWYRIKANYRDMEFIDNGVDVEEFVSFYTDYYQLSINLYKAMKECINILSQARFGKNLLVA
ncbi:hypothetical protein B6D29_00415 [Microgenomates bacterium UTCPR1]|nr:MAG: hypothetical protein B6D29_00415 [Microgenomates bacterium UTCPR1]